MTQPQISFAAAIQQGINALESIGCQYRVVEAGRVNSGPCFNDAAALRALAAICEQAAGVFDGIGDGSIVTNHDPRLFDIAIDLAAGFTPDAEPQSHP